ncbi:MAG: transglycosylase domain-containing protein, partial [Gemmatimonadaceae bacterium]
MAPHLVRLRAAWPGVGTRSRRLVLRFRACGPAVAALAVIATAAPAQDGDGAATEPWRIIQPAQSTLVLGRDGSLIGEIGKEWRTSVSIRTLPRYLPQAFVAIEDHRFYQHDGVDVVGIAGALRDMVRGQPRGASTITQQLVGNMHPDIIDRTDRSISRKLREQGAAREMEKHYSKEQILEAYLNQISFGRGWYGVEAAARHYFGKPAARLTLAEAATLAALPKGPALYDPIRYPDRARERRDLVLDRMADEKYITPAQAEEAKRVPVVTAPNAGMSAYAPYLVDLVRRDADRAGVPLANGGYRVHTTIDPALQRDATTALREGLARVEARPGYRHLTYEKRTRGRTDYLQGMSVMLDASSGDVLALVGGRDYSESQFNRAVLALRQPGSAFKPIVYAAAVRDSIAASEVVADTALSIPQENGTLYSPANSDGLFMGEMSLRDALAKSRNPVAVELGQRVGMDTVIALARRLGIDTPIAPYPSSAIGASAVRPLDFVAAFTSFANLGARA